MVSSKHTKKKALFVGILIVIGSLVLSALMAIRPYNVKEQTEKTLSNLTTVIAETKAENEELQALIEKLSTPQGSEEAIRRELHLVRPGETLIVVLPSTNTTVTPLDSSWPNPIMEEIAGVEKP